MSDGWGRLLLDRKLSSKGINLSRITPLDRLAFVEPKCMSALSYKPEIESEKNDSVLDFDSITNEMKQVFEDADTDILDALYQPHEGRINPL